MKTAQFLIRVVQFWKEVLLPEQEMGKQRNQESQKYLYLVTPEKYCVYAVRLTCRLRETAQLKPGLALAKEPAPSHQNPSGWVEESSLEQSGTFLEQVVGLIPPGPRAVTRTTLGAQRGRRALVFQRVGAPPTGPEPTRSKSNLLIRRVSSVQIKS